MIRLSPGSILGVSGALLAGVALTACALVQNGVPPVTPAMIRTAVADNGSAGILLAGRELLARRCTGCHVLEPVVRYTAEEWPLRVKAMAARARLTSVQEQQIVSYLVAARKTAGPSCPGLEQH